MSKIHAMKLRQGSLSAVLYHLISTILRSKYIMRQDVSFPSFSALQCTTSCTVHDVDVDRERLPGTHPQHGIRRLCLQRPRVGFSRHAPAPPGVVRGTERTPPSARFRLVRLCSFVREMVTRIRYCTPTSRPMEQCITNNPSESGRTHAPSAVLSRPEYPP